MAYALASTSSQPTYPLLSQHRANLPAAPLPSAPMQGWRKASEMHLYDNEAAPSA